MNAECTFYCMKEKIPQTAGIFFYIRELKEMIFKVKLKRRMNIGKETGDYEIFSSVRFTYWH